MIKDKLKEDYNLNIIKLEKNKDSTDGNVYNISTENKKYILKIYNNIEHAETISKLFEKIKNDNFYIPEIVKNKKGETYTIYNDSYLMIYSFLEGSEIQNVFKNLPDNISILIAKELRRFHDKTKELNNIHLNKVEFLDDRKLRSSVLHFDLTRGNIFYDKENNKIGLIDFDDAKYGPSIVDVSILIANLYFSKTRGVHLKGVKTFLEAYYGNDLELKNEEVRLINDIAIKWINYVLDGHEFDSSIKESFEVKIKLIKNIDFENI